MGKHSLYTFATIHLWRCFLCLTIRPENPEKKPYYNRDSQADAHLKSSAGVQASPRNTPHRGIHRRTGIPRIAVRADFRRKFMSDWRSAHQDFHREARTTDGLDGGAHGRHYRR